MEIISSHVVSSRFIEKGKSKIGIAKIPGIKIKAYRCKACGYIELYTK